MISDRPCRNMRPSAILTLPRMVRTLGATPRSTTLASVPVERNGIGAIRTDSGVNNGPSGPRAMPGASWMIFTESIETPLVISDVAPARVMSALSAEPDETSGMAISGSPQRVNDAHAHGADPRQQAAGRANKEGENNAQCQKRFGKDERGQKARQSHADDRDGHEGERQAQEAAKEGDDDGLCQNKEKDSAPGKPDGF